MLHVMYFRQLVAGVESANESITAAAAACNEGDNTTSETKEVKTVVESGDEGSTDDVNTCDVLDQRQDKVTSLETE